MDVVKRTDLPVHSWKRYGSRKLNQINRIVVHHFAGNITIEQAAELHVSKGWPGIGYWAVIDLDGTINIVNDLDTISYNVANRNTATVGIALRGDYSIEMPSPEMLYSLDKLITSIQFVLGKIPVHVHSDFVNTRCPGSRLREWVRMAHPSPQPLSEESKKSFFTRLFRKDEDHA